MDHAGAGISGMATALHERRLAEVVSALLATGARSILDLGCGRGELAFRLLGQAQFIRILGMDRSASEIALARARLALIHSIPTERLAFEVGSYLEPDRRLAGFDAAVMIETIEHTAPELLSVLERAVFRLHRPAHVLITTPNLEYNPLHGVPARRFRHPDHRFEWDRARFRRWCDGVAGRNGYAVHTTGIGSPPHPEYGCTTQMAVFRLAAAAGSTREMKREDQRHE